jgi:hypothetical protein
MIKYVQVKYKKIIRKEYNIDPDSNKLLKNHKTIRKM